MLRPSTLLLLTLACSSSLASTVWKAKTVFPLGSQPPTKASLEPCFDKAIQLLGISMNMHTDTTILKDILKEDMYLHDYKPVVDLLHAELSAPQPLRPFLEKVRQGITVNHPAVGVTLCIALENKATKSIFTNTHTARIIRAINHMVLLEKLVEKSAQDREFVERIGEHLDAKSQALTPGASFTERLERIHEGVGLFVSVKKASIDYCMEGLSEARGRGSISLKQEITHRIGVMANILEAVFADLACGHERNAQVGKRLAWEFPDTIGVTEDDARQLKHGYSDEWTQLYETWNLAFVTGNVHNLYLVYPKLLIPSVLLAANDKFIFHRVLALWLSLHFYVMSDLAKKPQLRFPEQTALAKLWGKVNLRFSDYVEHKKNVQVAPIATAATEFGKFIDGLTSSIDDLTSSVTSSMAKLHQDLVTKFDSFPSFFGPDQTAPAVA